MHFGGSVYCEVVSRWMMVMVGMVGMVIMVSYMLLRTLNCCSTLVMEEPQSIQRKVANSSSGRTSDVRVTVPLTLSRVPILAELRALILYLCAINVTSNMWDQYRIHCGDVIKRDPKSFVSLIFIFQHKLRVVFSSKE